MFIQDLRGEFFNFLVGKRVVIIANFDIDSITASKILQTLFCNEQIMFTFVPVWVSPWSAVVELVSWCWSCLL